MVFSEILCQDFSFGCTAPVLAKWECLMLGRFIRSFDYHGIVSASPHFNFSSVDGTYPSNSFLNILLGGSNFILATGCWSLRLHSILNHAIFGQSTGERILGGSAKKLDSWFRTWEFLSINILSSIRVWIHIFNEQFIAVLNKSVTVRYLGQTWNVHFFLDTIGKRRF